MNMMWLGKLLKSAKLMRRRRHNLYIMANYGMQIVDAGVPVQNMHAPMEVSSKVDLYETKQAYVAFLKEM